MCNAVVSVNSDKIEENNCSDETNPNIVMTDSNIESITELYLGGNNISKITGIEYFTNLTNLYLYNNQITDLTPLEELVNLTTLSLGYNQISDLTPLKDLTNLTELYLHKNQITDLTPLKDLTSLTDLYLNGNQITDLTSLKDLTSLTSLNLYNNQITDLAPLSKLTKLERLDVAMNPLNDISPILQINLTDQILSTLGENFSSVTSNSQIYNLPSLFLLYNTTLDITPVAPWVTEYQDIVRDFTQQGLARWDFKNVTMNDDGKSVTIEDVAKPAVIELYFNEPGRGWFLLSKLTITYEEPVDPVDPTDDPVVPNTGKNTQESSTAILTVTLCILSGIALTAIPMIRLYRKTNSK